MDRPVGVIGAGSFGSTIASLISENKDVLIYSRNQSEIDAINAGGPHKGIMFSERVSATGDLKELADKCNLIFPVIPAASFRTVIKQIAPYISPLHLIIHATKGLDIVESEKDGTEQLNGSPIRTMSQVITEECSTLRVGCISGPNLSKEINMSYPTAAVIASEFQEVIEQGQIALASARFFVFGSHQIFAAELAGAFKNIIAIGSGILGGRELGKNMQALLITRGLREIIHVGIALGAEGKAFLGTAGLGDLIATATSENSRNYNFGRRLAAGDTVEEIEKTEEEVAEGVRTLQIMKYILKKYKLHAPILELIYEIVFEHLDIDKAISHLMRYPFAPDVDFL
ncbi:NAD(P)H-dependent glycerol-3-phosphate dehydrogenase [Portibacter marinus]|uniref:NAD(P)H-dependent glycerol-3-phosphate dehydrogenase n=1 Tax=Portibacter marinus TaxID=2898660 RepID=UPI001F49057B|nr:NAD(P)H-dependent glycerol-3-phosphate dehydrogenase [Portibacter marinus]